MAVMMDSREMTTHASSTTASRVSLESYVESDSIRQEGGVIPPKTELYFNECTTNYSLWFPEA
jgi:hypothetical protein